MSTKSWDCILWRNQAYTDQKGYFQHLVIKEPLSIFDIKNNQIIRPPEVFDLHPHLGDKNQIFKREVNLLLIFKKNLKPVSLIQCVCAQRNSH